MVRTSKPLKSIENTKLATVGRSAINWMFHPEEAEFYIVT